MRDFEEDEVAVVFDHFEVEAAARDADGSEDPRRARDTFGLVVHAIRSASSSIWIEPRGMPRAYSAHVPT